MFSQSYYSNGQRHQQQLRSDANHQWQPVPRPWGNFSPEASQDAGLIHNPGHSFCDHSDPTGKNGGGHGWTRFTQAELGRFNQQHARTTSMDVWMATSQREGPWDGVGRIRNTADNVRNGQ